MGIDWNNRNYMEDPPTQEEIERAERQKAFETHKLCDCGSNDCGACRAELALCTVCGGAEGGLPYSCPGARMTAQQHDDVYAGKIDFIAGEWRVPVPKENKI